MASRATLCKPAVLLTKVSSLNKRRLPEGLRRDSWLLIYLPAHGTIPTAARAEVPAQVQGLLVFVIWLGLPTLRHNHTALTSIVDAALESTASIT